MQSDFKNKFKELFQRIKKIKHIEIYLAVGVAAIMVLIYLFASAPKADENKQLTNNDNIVANFSSSQEYVNYLENKLATVLTEVKGAGEVNVVITLEKGFEYIYATEEETHTTSNGTTVTTSTIEMVNGQPVLKEEIYPVIKGIVVISSGANDVSVKMDMLSVIQTVIDVSSSKINIIQGN